MGIFIRRLILITLFFVFPICSHFMIYSNEGKNYYKSYFLNPKHNSDNLDLLMAYLNETNSGTWMKYKSDNDNKFLLRQLGFPISSGKVRIEYSFLQKNTSFPDLSTHIELTDNYQNDLKFETNISGIGLNNLKASDNPVLVQFENFQVYVILRNSRNSNNSDNLIFCHNVSGTFSFFPFTNSSIAKLNFGNCSFEFEANLVPITNEQIINEGMAYSIFIAAIFAFCIFTSSYELKMIQNDHNYAKKFSFVQMCNQILCSTYLVIFHIIVLWKMIWIATIFIIPLLAQFLYLTCLQFILIEKVYRIQNNQHSISLNENLISKAVLFKCISKKLFYAILILILILVEFLYNQLAFIVLVSLLWIPQIFNNIFSYSAKAPSFCYIISQSILQIFPYLYFKAYDKNFAKEEICYLSTSIVLALILFQIVILSIQKHLGTQSIIPKKLKYFFINDPFTNILINNINIDCSICLTDFEQNRTSKNFSFVKTPCHHTFHIECLNKWFQLKQECPMCRNELPPLNHDG